MHSQDQFFPIAIHINSISVNNFDLSASNKLLVEEPLKKKIILTGKPEKHDTRYIRIRLHFKNFGDWGERFVLANGGHKSGKCLRRLKLFLRSI